MDDTVTATMAHRLAEVRARVSGAVERGGHGQDVRIVAITKTVEVARVVEAYEAGQRDFGENRVQEARVKLDNLRGGAPEARWHLVGHLQSNKVKLALDLFSLLHSVDTIELATRIDRTARSRETTVDVLAQVNVSGEQPKFGMRPSALGENLLRLMDMPSLCLRGLMTIAPQSSTAERARPYFAHLRDLRDELVVEHPGLVLNELSMGMTNDFEVAVEEGATIVRVGRAIFGERLA